MGTTAPPAIKPKLPTKLHGREVPYNPAVAAGYARDISQSGNAARRLRHEKPAVRGPKVRSPRPGGYLKVAGPSPSRGAADVISFVVAPSFLIHVLMQSV